MTIGSPPPKAPKRSRARRFVPLALAAWLVLEVWLLVLVAEQAGGLAVLGLLLAGAVLGAVVIKRAGRNAYTGLNETLRRAQNGEPPESGGTGGNGFLFLAGVLLMLPGLVSDAAGLVLLVPAVRTRLSRFTERFVERRIATAAAGGLGGAFQQARIHRPDGKIVQGEVVREEERGDSGPSGAPKPPLTP
jgi:UPF0716 protein FxsA